MLIICADSLFLFATSGAAARLFKLNRGVADSTRRSELCAIYATRGQIIGIRDKRFNADSNRDDRPVLWTILNPQDYIFLR